MNLSDEEAAKFATDGWLKRVADVPMAEVPAMVLEDPSTFTVLLGSLRHARADFARVTGLLSRELDAERVAHDETRRNLRAQAASNLALVRQASELRAAAKHLVDASDHCAMCQTCGDGPCCDSCERQHAALRVEQLVAGAAKEQGQ